MEQATPTDPGQPTVQQMFATLLGEIASLRQQNEEQKGQLEHLQGDMSLVLKQRKNYFERLPPEIREMIWLLAVPVQLLAFEGVSEMTPAPSALSIPTVAHLCQESRRVVMSRNMVTALSGRSTHLEAPSQLWRLEHTKSPECQWTWFCPRKDALVINPRRFRPLGQYKSGHLIVQAAEHIIVDTGEFWNQYSEACVGNGGTGILMTFTTEQLSQVVTDLTQLALDLLRPATISFGLEGDPVYNLRTIDFAMADFLKVGQDYPPNLVRRLFTVGDGLRILDLRDEEAVFGVERMLKDELSKVMDLDRSDWQYSTLQNALANFGFVADGLFPRIRATILRAVADSYHQTTILAGFGNKVLNKEKKKRVLAPLPSPFRDGELDMEVTWVKELTKSIEIRPVFVFVRD